MKLKLSSVAILIVVLACLTIDMGFKNWEKQQRVIEWDIHSYYAYLPAGWIYKDIHLTKSDYRFDEHYWLFWPNQTKEGKNVIKTTMGMAILYAPFFVVAHTITNLSDYPENGISEPYKFLLLMSTLFYLFVGLDFLKKILEHYRFSDLHTSVTILLIGLGTNLTAYASQSAPMSHVYSFCLFAAFIYYTIKWHQFQTLKNTLIIGFLIGLISLIRPSNIIIMLFFALYNITSLYDLKERILLFKKTFPLLLLMLSAFFIVWVPQFIYWKISSGSYFYYSYPDEQFFFNDPKIMKGLFGFRKGWLIYTPMMAFALAGIFALKGISKKIRLPIVLFFIVNIYITFSWWCWWYGGSFGQRGLIESYALLAIPFASFVKYVSEKRWYYNAVFYCTAVFFVWLNLFQTLQFENMSLHYDGMTRVLYFKQFGKLDKIDDFASYVSSLDYEEAKKGKR
ncbi:MAG: hypothetical protein Q8L90_14540 [Bacteroidota bacterium]|nr:hypothetical protein [Bacteroidota bacterium]